MPNLRTNLISVISTCTSLRHLKPLLSLAVTSGLLRRDPFVSGRLVAALSFLSLPLSLLAFSSAASPSAFAFTSLILFDEMPDRTVVTYNAVVSRFAITGSELPGLSLFADMLASQERSKPNADTFVAALSCCAGLGSLAHGRTVHALAACLLDSPQNAELGTKLIHMYAKCGSLAAARQVFSLMETKDASAWTAMIAALAMHSRGEDAVQMFDEMVKTKGMSPDSVTFTCVLHACSHSGLAEKGSELFDEMKRVYGIEPRMEHYGAVVDLLGRAGLVAEAKKVVESMPFEPNRVVWGSLLHACLVNGESKVTDQELEKRAFTAAEGVGFFVGVSNMYAKSGRWDEVEKVRERMAERGMKKEKGFSLVEVNGKVFKFLVGDVRHPLTLEIYQMLDWIYGGMISEG
ncbi:pentatricopeptide repeat-containing protein At1g59720, chloroplastic/mitochondrial-like [Typha latifolia]|uniref:pentatricopeptide repeat-containing protein At1g59720, chloroplastic/mitochondrial-like n=1 Tax=Typha latifolia TaxID=4733 RepID=UPI003C2FA930